MNNKLIEIEAMPHNLTIVNDCKDERYSIRWDGCVHIEHWSNGDKYTNIDSPNRDYLHICDLHEFIEELQELEKKAKEHFGEEWPDL